MRECKVLGGVKLHFLSLTFDLVHYTRVPSEPLYLYTKRHVASLGSVIRQYESNQAVRSSSPRLPFNSSSDSIRGLQAQTHLQDDRTTPGNHSAHHHRRCSPSQSIHRESCSIPFASLLPPFLPSTARSTTAICASDYSRPEMFTSILAIGRGGECLF